MTRQKSALRLLEQTTNLTERARIMINAGLGAMFIDELPQFIENGLCKFVSYNTPSPNFYDGDPDKPDYTKSENGVFLRIVIQDVGEVHFAGLIEQFGDKEKASRIVHQILHPYLESGTFGRDDMIAARTYIHGTDLHREVEVCAFGNLMRGQVNLILAMRNLPTHVRERGEDVQPAILGLRTPVEDWLKPLTNYLIEIGVTQERINTMLLSVLSEKNNLCEMEKVVALVGAYSGQKEALSTVLGSQQTQILKLQFNRPNTMVMTNHMKFLRRHGCLSYKNMLLEREVFIEQISMGNLSMVYQHFLLLEMERSRTDRLLDGKNPHITFIKSLLPAAFQKAMEERRYGVAAALTQINAGNVTTPEETMRALNMAIVMRQPIRLDWNSYVMAPTVVWEDQNR